MTPAEAEVHAALTVAGLRAYLSAAGWTLDRGSWRDPDATGWPCYPDTPAGVARAAFVERARWAIGVACTCGAVGRHDVHAITCARWAVA